MDFDQEHNSEDSSNDEISYHGEDDDDDQMSSDDDIDEDDTIIVGQRVRLEGDDKDRIAQLLPVGPYIGTLFVTCVTTTNLRRYDMKPPKKIVEKAGIPDNGCVGLQLGAEGTINICSYNKIPEDGRLSIDMLRWRTFVAGKNLHVGQLVLILLRESNDSTMQVLFEIQLVI